MNNEGEDEVLDLVNSADSVIGQINRSDYGKLATEKLGYIRSVNAFICMPTASCGYHAGPPTSG